MTPAYKTDLEIIERVRSIQKKAGELDLIFRDGNEQALFNAMRSLFTEADLTMDRLNQLLRPVWPRPHNDIR